MCYITHVLTVIAAYEQHNIKAQCASNDEYSHLHVAVYELLKYARGFSFGVLYIKIIMLYVIIQRITSNQISCKVLHYFSSK